MAKQHFYSRVPSKMSMFLKADGFDTFACSIGINRDYLEKDMLPILDQKPTYEENSLIRLNQLSPIYMSYSLKDGQYIQSCVSYLPLDFTGERTSYMVHSLLFEEDEEKTVTNRFDHQLINEELFLHDLDSFDVTNSKPIIQYEEKEYKFKKLSRKVAYLVDELDTITLKKCIFACLGAIFGKYKSVFVIFPNGYEDADFLEFFNSLIQIFPYHLRKYLSFVSRVCDFNKYPNFKLKIVQAENVGQAPITKGITVDFRLNTVNGIKDPDLKNFGHLGDFFYNLLKSEQIREEFLACCEYQVNNMPRLGELNFNELDNLVYLFRVGCSLFDQKEVLPNDDKVLDFFSIYEKYREALNAEYRIHAISSLKRYPENYLMIPKNVFSKISKIYPTEIPGTKHIIMRVCMELIHTDLMRPLLFTFIKNNYEDEDEDSKADLVPCLASVFYGGFLQPQIIAFFDSIFDDETVENRRIILEKLFLAIRTKDIQEPLFEFVSKHYQNFNYNEKIMYLEAAAEHLPEGDTLATKLLTLSDMVIDNEDEELQSIYTKKLYKVLNDEQKRKEQLLLPLIASSNGFTFKRMVTAIFDKWKTKKITSDFIALACCGTINERINKIINIWTNAPSDVDDKLATKVAKACVQGFNDNPLTFELNEIVEGRKLLYTTLESFAQNPSTSEFIDKFSEEVLNPLIDKTLLNAFKSKEPDVIEKMLDDIDDSKSIRETDNYQIVLKYRSMKREIINDDYANAIIQANDFAGLGELKKRVSAYLIIDLINSGKLRENIQDSNDVHYDRREILTYIIANYIKTEEYGFAEAYNVLDDRFKELYIGEKDSAWLVQTENCMVARDVFTYGSLFQKTVVLPEYFRKKVATSESAISNVASSIIVKYGNNQLKAIFNKVNPYSEELFDYIKDQTKKVKSNAKMFAKIIK